MSLCHNTARIYDSSIPLSDTVKQPHRKAGRIKQLKDNVTQFTLEMQFIQGDSESPRKPDMEETEKNMRLVYKKSTRA